MGEIVDIKSKMKYQDVRRIMVNEMLSAYSLQLFGHKKASLREIREESLKRKINEIFNLA